jgi:transposase-like protein
LGFAADLADGAAFNALRTSRFIEAISCRVGMRFSSSFFSNSSIVEAPVTLFDIVSQFDSDDRCRELLERLRWPYGPECIRCHTRELARLDSKLFYCKACDYQFTVTAGTIFHDSHLPLIKWFVATILICEAKKGMSAMQLKRTLWGKDKGSYQTAWYLCHRIRRTMKQVEQPMLDGTVEMDETYVGGKSRGYGQGWRGERHQKQVVIGIRQRDGALRFFHAEDAKTGTLAKYIQENISTDVDVIMTDELPAYRKAVGSARHETVNHRAKEYVRLGTDIHSNSIESAFSLLKRGIMGTWHKISAKHLQAYLDEMTFRFDRRKRSDLFIDTLRHMVTADPMTFEKLTAA